MALIPPLIHGAARLDFLDVPGHRKIHAEAIPRVGGIAMVVGFVLPVLFWLPINRELAAFLIGLSVLFVFGIWDDRRDLDYRIKFLGQLIAVLMVVLYGDVVVAVVPFFGLDPVPAWFSIPLTVVALVGITNAINLADGLDGLAAGTTLLSLAAIGLMAFYANGTQLVLMTVATIGVSLGFLRFNTYPARIFMGDTGSQFLGFTVGVLAIVLTQKTNTALNPALPLLLLGLPVFDTLYVTATRIYHRRSPFAPDNNHVHHKLLALGLDHYEAVALIYLAQAAFVAAAVVFRYQSDLFVVSLYLVINLLFSMILYRIARSPWRAHQPGRKSKLARAIAALDESSTIQRVPLTAVRILLPTGLVVGSILAPEVARDLGATAAVLFVLLSLRLAFGYKLWFLLLRLLIYVTGAVVVYLTAHLGAGLPESQWINAEYAYNGVLIAALVFGVRYTKNEAFRVTPTDFLVGMIVVALGFVPQAHLAEYNVAALVVKLVIFFYASELIMRNMTSRWNGLTLSALWALGVIAVRGIG